MSAQQRMTQILKQNQMNCLYFFLILLDFFRNIILDFFLIFFGFLSYIFGISSWTFWISSWKLVIARDERPVEDDADLEADPDVHQAVEDDQAGKGKLKVWVLQLISRQKWFEIFWSSGMGDNCCTAVLMFPWKVILTSPHQNLVNHYHNLVDNYPNLVDHHYKDFTFKNSILEITNN